MWEPGLGCLRAEPRPFPQLRSLGDVLLCLCLSRPSPRVLGQHPLASPSTLSASGLCPRPLSLLSLLRVLPLLQELNSPPSAGHGSERKTRSLGCTWPLSTRQSCRLSCRGLLSSYSGRLLLQVLRGQATGAGFPAHRACALMGGTLGARVGN